MKPHVSISYGFGEDNRYNLSYIPESIQLAIYKYDIYDRLKNKMFEQLEEGNIIVKAVHLPLDTLRTDLDLIIDMIKNLRKVTGARNFIIHPNKHIKSFLSYFMENDPQDIVLCIENFQWRKKKKFRSPLQALSFIQFLREHHEHAFDNIGLCFDTSHADDIWFDYKIMSYLLPYINVIHLSNRQGKTQHIPFNSGKGELNLVGFIKELVSRYKWNRDIVLEYMPEYHHKLIPNAKYIKDLINRR